MPRTKKRKQGHVAKLESKSFPKSQTAAVSISLQYRIRLNAVMPDYISRNIHPDCQVNSMAEVLGRPELEGICSRETPVGMIRPNNRKDRRWAIRRILAGLYLDHLGLEKQLYRRSGILLSEFCARQDDDYNDSCSEIDSTCFRVWDLLRGAYKIVDGEHKPLTAFLREALINNEGSPRARTTWAMLLVAISERGPDVSAKIRVQHTYSVTMRTTRPKIEVAQRQLNTLRFDMEPIKTERDMEALINLGVNNLPRGWGIGDINALESRLVSRVSQWVKGAGHASATRYMAADMRHIDQVDGRRTRLGILFYKAESESAGRHDPVVYFEVSPHKAVVTMVSLISDMSNSRPNWVAADPRPILNELLEKDTKDLTMAEVIRAFKRIWPLHSTMPDKEQNSHYMRENLVRWYPMPFQHAAHTK